MHEHQPNEIFTLIERVGSKSNYQRQIFLLFAGAWFVTGFLILSIAFLFMPNRFSCPHTKDQSACHKWVCSKPEVQWASYEQQHRVYSLLMEFGQYQCNYTFWVSVYKSVLFTGILVGYLSFTHISDNAGRRTAMMATWITTCSGLVILLLSTNIFWACVGLFLAGAGSETSLRISLAMINEVVDFTLRQMYSLLLQGSFGLSGCFVALAYYNLSEWRTVMLICCLLPSLTIMLVMTLYLQETPSHLSRQPQRLLESLRRIAVTNKLECDITLTQIQAIVHHEKEQQQQRGSQQFTLFDLFRYNSLKQPTKWLSVMILGLSSLYVGPSTVISAFGMDEFTLQAAMSTAELVSCLVACYGITHTQRRKSALINTSLISLFSLVGYLVGYDPECSLCGRDIFRLIMMLASRFCLSYFYCVFFLYIVELYPQPVRSIGFGVVSGMGAVGGVLVQHIMALVLYYHHDPLIYMALFAVVCFWAARKLPQTQGQPLATHIAELKPTKTKKSYEPSLQQSNAQIDSDDQLSHRAIDPSIQSTQTILEGQTP